MSIAVTTDFLAGASVRTRAYITDDADAYVDPSTVNIEITSSAGATVVSSTTTMDKSTVGIYEHYYNTASTAPTGFYKTTITVTDGTGETAKITKGQVSFRIK